MAFPMSVCDEICSTEAIRKVGAKNSFDSFQEISIPVALVDIIDEFSP